VYAVKTAGLAVGVGMVSSCIVLVSFIWGIFIFHEHVHNQFASCFAILCMMSGVFGMGYYSSPTIQPEIGYRGLVSRSSSETENPEDQDRRCDGFADSPYLGPIEGADRAESVDAEQSSIDRDHNNHDGESHENIFSRENDIDQSRYDGIFLSPHQTISLPSMEQDQRVTIGICGCYQIKVSKRALGMAAGAFSGFYGGSILAPMKFCKSDATRGTHFLISFAIGASIVNLALWFIRYMYHVTKHKSFVTAYYMLPSFHLRVMALPGGLAGLLWSIGNFFSLISVYYLGEGVGYPLVQTAILVAGLWGIFYFKEVSGFERISKWLLSSLLTIFGILLLSYEHHAK
jgi:hypothetical protein